eukprot:4523259-Ditylum_brightwellii.AAC.1
MGGDAVFQLEKLQANVVTNPAKYSRHLDIFGSILDCKLDCQYCCLQNDAKSITTTNINS